MDKEIVKYAGCFVCGDENTHGLQARFFFDGKQAYTDVVADDKFEGYRRIYHGGIIATLLDEVMIKAVLAQEKYVVTAEMTVKFLKPVTTGDRLHVAGRITRGRGRVYLTEGEVVGPDGEPYATAVGKYVEAGPELKEKLLQSIES